MNENDKVDPEFLRAEQENYDNYELEAHRLAEKRQRDEYRGRKARESFNSGEHEDSSQKNAKNLLAKRLASRVVKEIAPMQEEVSQIGEREQRIIDAMRKLIGHNLVTAARENRRLSREESDSKLVLRLLEDATNDFSKSNPDIDEQVELIESIVEERKKLADQTPESYTLVHGLEFREHSRQVKAGEMVTTPYVEEHMDRVKKNIAEGTPTFIHGHLGSGKTELAMNAAREASMEKAAYDEAQKDLDAFCESHPDASPEECTAEFGRAYRQHLATFEKAFKDGDSWAHDRFEPLFISGSKDLTSQDLYTEKTLKLAKFDDKTILEHKDELDAEIEKWKQAHPDEAKDPEKLHDAAEHILEIYIHENGAFGTEVETIKKEIYRAVEEGRPVIIDEVNAIPAAVLISLNNILTRRPGDSCPIPNRDPEYDENGKEKPFIIQPGFAIIMTGNLSSGGIDYFGTERFNPAFLDRLDTFEHSYLPMSENGTLGEQADPKRNELFHVIISYLADEKGNLQLRDMDETLEKLFSLCQLAHEVQNIFSGKIHGTIKMDSDDDINADLNQSVLSVRNILKILKGWRRGQEKDLDKALFDEYIAGITDADDQNLIIVLARKYGFFKNTDGYQVKAKERGAGPTTWDEIHPDEYIYQREPMETYSVRKVVELLYGTGPTRDVADYPDSIDFDGLDKEGDEIEADDKVTEEDLDNFEKQLKEFDKIITALEVLGEKCGCPVGNNNTGE